MASATIATLPRFVSFQGDNGKFLCQEVLGETAIFLFPRARYIGDDTMGLQGVFEVIPHPTRGFYLQSLFNNRYLQHGTLASRSRDVSFFEELPENSIQMEAIQVDSDTVGLRYVVNSNYMYRMANDAANFHQSAIIEDRTRLVVGEPVLARRLLSVDYHLEKAEIYDVTPVVLASSSVTNNSNHVGDLTLTVEYSRSTESTFSNATTVGASVTVGATMRIPFIAELSIELSAYTEASWQWGSTSTETTTVTGSYTIRDVGPGDAVMLQVTATRAKCRVPFSYSQRDTIVDGRLVTSNRTDGIFEGVDVFHIEWVPTNIATGARLAGYLMEA